MLIREHRGNLQDSMSTVEMIGNFIIDVKVHVFQKLREYLPQGTTAADLKLNFSSMLYDNRTSWNTIIVTVDGYGVFGMINQYPLDYSRTRTQEP